MNIQNITALADSLQSLGFQNTILQQLVKNISLNVPNYIIHQRMIKGNDVINFHLTFEMNGTGNAYSFVHYDATLRKEIEIPDTKINEIEVKELDKRMGEINWGSLFESENKKWKTEDKTTWLEEEKVENIVTDLHAWEPTEEGKEMAIRLKVKYWCDTPLEELFSDLRSLRTRFEISQRFYFFEGQSGISTEEAYRFLHNKWMEKQLQMKRKQSEVSTVEDQSNGEAKRGSGKNLLQKKSRNKNNKMKIS